MAQPESMRVRPGIETSPDASYLPYRCVLMPLHTPDATNTDARLSKGVASPQCSTKPRGSRHQTFTVPQAYCSSPVASMNLPLSRPPSVEAMKAIISRAVPDTTIESIWPLPSARLQRDARVQLSGGRILMLTIPPSSMLRLLRSEQWLVLSEALVIPWMCRRALDHAARDERISIHYLIDTTSHRIGPSGPTSTEKTLARSQMANESILRYLPTLIAHSSSSTELGSAFNLTEHPRGVTILSLSQRLPEIERMIVEYQKGQFVRRVANFRAPNSRFGPVVAIIATPSSLQGNNTAAAVGSGGADTWQKAFLSLVEGALRDGEDLSVTISYSLIRHHMYRLSHLLDAVSQSRLVILDGGSDANILVSRGKSDEERDPAEPSILSVDRRQGLHINTKAEENSGVMPFGKERPGVGTSPIDSRSCQNGNTGLNDLSKPSANTSNFTVTGLRDWSNCIFGDPLMTSIFSEGPSADFLRGFRQQPISSAAASPTGPYNTRISSPPPDDFVEDRRNAPVRLLLYECYHATVCVIKQFYRPSGADGTKPEMEARRRLAAVLKKLADVEENATKRPRTASAEVWPVKKPKSDPRHH